MSERYSESLSDVGTLVTLACRSHRSSVDEEVLRTLFARLGADGCRRAAEANKVAWLVADTLDGLVRLPADWRSDLELNQSRMSLQIRELVRLGAVFDGEGVSWALIENGGVLFSSSMAERAFCSGDLDLLFDPESWDRAQAILRAEGYEARARRHGKSPREEWVKHVEEHPCWVNVGPTAFDRMWLPLDVQDRTAAWLARRVRSTRREGLWVLRPEDLMAQIGVHTSLHGYVRTPFVRLHVDTDRLVTDAALDWTDVVTEVKAMSAQRRVAVTLAMAFGLLGSEVPDSVFEALGWGSREARIADRLSHVGVIQEGEAAGLSSMSVLALDARLHQRGLGPWLCRAIWPPNSFLQAQETKEMPVFQMQVRRYRRALDQVLARLPKI